jgi:hypothetical protein
MIPPVPAGVLHGDPLHEAVVVTPQLPPPKGDVEGPPLMTMADALVATPKTAINPNVPTSLI